MEIRSFLSKLFRIVLYGLGFVAILIVGIIIYYFATLFSPGDAQEGYLVLSGATVLVGEELEPRDDTTVLIRDGVIVGIGDRDDVDIPPEAATHDLSGYTLMPGLIDMHVHMGSPATETDEEPGPMMVLKLVADWMRFFPNRRCVLLEHGVTTIRSAGDDHEWILEFRQMIRDGQLEGPRLFIAGPMFTTTGGHPVVTIGIESGSGSVRVPSTPEEARNDVRKLTGSDSTNVDFIKVVQERGRAGRPLEPIDPGVLHAIVDEAHNHGIPVFAHWGTTEDLNEVLAAGVDGLEHIEPRGVLKGWPEGITDTLVKRNITLGPTLTVTDTALPSDVSQQLRKRVGEFHDAGGRIVTSSDSGMPGVPFGSSVHRELELLVESGLTPRDALIAATSEAARALRTGQIGVIEVGRAADLVVVDGNPHEEIQAIRNVVMVFRDGRLVVDD